MAKLSITIMGHPDRSDLIEKIKDKLDDPRVNIALDTENLGCWGNAKRAWEMADPNSTHHLVIQDDVMPCNNFIEGAEKALRFNPDKLVSFFSLYKIADKAEADNHSWFTSNKGWGQALCMPSHWIPHYLEWCKENIQPDYPSCDARFSAFAMANNLKVWNTNPSLVEHIEPNNSVMGNNPPIDRTARNLIDEDKDPVDIDWEIPLNPHHKSNYLKEYNTNILKEEFYNERCSN